MLLMTRLRVERGWSKSELARRAGLNQVTVNLVESSRFIPYRSQLDKLAVALGVDPRKPDILLQEVDA